MGQAHMCHLRTEQVSAIDRNAEVDYDERTEKS